METEDKGKIYGTLESNKYVDYEMPSWEGIATEIMLGREISCIYVIHHPHPEALHPNDFGCLQSTCLCWPPGPSLIQGPWPGTLGRTPPLHLAC